MTEELFSIIFNYIYIPFASSSILMAAFFWNLHKKNREDIEFAITRLEVEEMVDIKLAAINDRQNETVRTLYEISNRLEKGNELMGRLDERLKAVDARLDDKVNSLEKRLSNRE